MTDPITAQEFGFVEDRGASTLQRLLILKAQRKAIEDEIGGIEQLLKIELTNDPDPIVDGEHGISAVLKERKAPASIDLISMATVPQHQALIVEAARMGLLDARLTPLRAQKGKSEAADALLHYELPAGVTMILSVEEA